MTLKEYQDTPYAWPGGYQILALMGDNEVLCHGCCCDKSNPIYDEVMYLDGDDRAWGFVAGFIHWEGSPEYCAHCNKELKSEYGEVE